MLLGFREVKWMLVGGMTRGLAGRDRQKHCEVSAITGFLQFVFMDRLITWNSNRPLGIRLCEGTLIDDMT